MLLNVVIMLLLHQANFGDSVKLGIARQPRSALQIYTSFLIFYCYFIHLGARELGFKI